MLESLFQWLRFGKLNHFTVDNRSCVALADEILEKVDKLSLFLINQLGENLKSRAVFELKNLVNNLLWRLLYDLFAALGAVWNSNASPEQPQVVVNLGYRSDG